MNSNDRFGIMCNSSRKSQNIPDEPSLRDPITRICFPIYELSVPLRPFSILLGSSIFEDKLSEHQCDKLLSEGGFLVRNVFDFDRDTPSSFWYVIKDSFGGMEELSAKMRNQIRRSFKTCDIRMVSKEEMLSDGYTR